MNLHQQLTHTLKAHDAFTVGLAHNRGFEWECTPCGIVTTVDTLEEGDDAVHDHLADTLQATVAEWLRYEAQQVARRDAGEPVGQEVIEAKLEALADEIAPAVSGG